MTLKEWIASREPAPPQALARQMQMAIESIDEKSGGDRFDDLLAAATQILRAIPGDRGGAVALLAADALITYAFESTVDQCDQLSARADEAIRRISALG